MDVYQRIAQLELERDIWKKSTELANNALLAISNVLHLEAPLQPNGVHSGTLSDSIIAAIEKLKLRGANHERAKTGT